MTPDPYRGIRWGFCRTVHVNWFALAAFLAVATCCVETRATMKPEFATHSAALRAWFKLAKPTEWAEKQFQLQYCCEQAERVHVKFAQPNREVEEWWAQCTDDIAQFCSIRGKKTGEWVQIPPGIIHHEPIKTPKEFPASDGSKGVVGDVESAQVELEFQQLRIEGVLFVYRGNFVCFWPPESEI